jgi:hypothetical protein
VSIDVPTERLKHKCLLSSTFAPYPCPPKQSASFANKNVLSRRNPATVLGLFPFSQGRRRPAIIIATEPIPKMLPVDEVSMAVDPDEYASLREKFHRWIERQATAHPRLGTEVFLNRMRTMMFEERAPDVIWRPRTKTSTTKSAQPFSSTPITSKGLSLKFSGRCSNAGKCRTSPAFALISSVFPSG